MDEENNLKREINPRVKANIFSICTFFYTLNLFRKGYKKDLEEDDIYKVIDSFKSKELGDMLEKQWKIEKIEEESPSVFRLLFKCYGTTYLLLALSQFFAKTIMILLAPQALSKLISYFTPNQTNISRQDVFYYAAVVIGLNILNSIYTHNYMQIITELGIRVKTGLCSIIYRKSLKLDPLVLSNITIGKIITLISKDVFTIDSASTLFIDLVVGFTQIAIVTYLIYLKIGIPAFAGTGFLILVIPIQLYIGHLTSKNRVKANKLSDKRLQVTQETLSYIKIIKLYTWEKFFESKISTARKEEITGIRKIYYIKMVSLIIGALTTNVGFYLLMMSYIWSNGTITAEIVYFVMGCFQSLRLTITLSIPIGISQLAEVIASFKRIRKMLLAEELKKPKRVSNSPLKPVIQLDSAYVEINDSEILNNITITIHSGLNLLTGPVGSGKSFLLKTILEDYSLTKGNLKVHGKISYASQEPWLFPSSVKQNILFGQKYDENRYQRVLEVCALRNDIDNFENGDNTFVGDRGLSLSKGQQARINLARAVYYEADIYLLDDCLSSLDQHVNEFVFNKCIKDFLKDKICVLVSHSPNHIKSADNVIIIENGSIKSQTKPDKIAEKDIKYFLNQNDLKDNKSADEPKIIDEDLIDENELLVKENKGISNNIYHEIKKIGKVDFKNYIRYCKFGGGCLIITLIAILYISSQVVISYAHKLVSQWVNLEQKISDFKVMNLTNTTEYSQTVKDNQTVLTLYTIFTLGSTLVLFVKAYTHFTFSCKASDNLHKSVVSTVVNATMEFFDTHFIGNILNRFSKDLTTVDEYLPFLTYECLRMVCFLIGIIILIASVNAYFLIPSAVFFIILLIIRKYYISTGRSLKRLESATQSPVIGYVNSSLEGLTTIRACGNQNILKKEFDEHQDLNTSSLYMMKCTLRAFSFLLDILCFVFISIIILRFVLGKIDTEAGNVGLAITQAFMLAGLLQWTIRQWAELENQMTSVERILEYTEVNKENKSGQILQNWPKNGSIKYENVYLSYSSTREIVLKNINFTIESKEKIGIVGRTGAGKTSIISTLFRLYDIQGTIRVDDVNIKLLSLNFLRSNIAIIPQDPVLFSGTIRSNIDPTNTYSNEEIWNAIETAKLKHLINNLDFVITESGSNFSSGQRQLICLARAIVSKNKIIVLDEATANVDPETDTLIHFTIQENFASCTVITIAHRLHSVLYSDKVMVVDKGEIVEFDKPKNLLKNQNGMFYKMVKRANLLPAN